MKLFLIPIILMAAAAWAFFGFIVWSVPPKIGGFLVISNLFYFLLSGGIGLALTSGLLLYFISSFLQPMVRGVNPTSTLRRLLFQSLRRGLFFSLVIVGFITLKVFGLLNLLNAALVLGIVILAEIYFTSR
ncbi:MAG: hypothetical protein Q8O75_03665 [bacterium]|nr:hypothetical protein [bacterium]